MGLFSNNKKLCPICGNPTPRLLATKVENMPICKACDKKVDLPVGTVDKMTLEEFQQYMAYYDENEPLRAAVGGTAGDALVSARGQNVFRQGVAVEVFLPLVGHHAAHAAQCCFDQSHFLSPFIVMIYAMVGYVFHTLPFYYIVSAQVNR